MLLVRKEFGIPFDVKLPAKTYVDENGNVQYSCWTLLGFLERIYETPKEDLAEELRNIRGQKNMTTVHSAI